MAIPPTERALLSVVVPCFDEEAVVPETHRRIAAVLDEVPGLGLEFVYVDDGSRDATLEYLREIQSNDSRVRVIALSRNFGHQIAVSAGLAEAGGDAVAVIDADLQDPPEALLRMLEHWCDGADVVYGVRSAREGETALKRWTASAFYRLLGRLADVSIPLDTGDFRLMDRRAVDVLLAMPERDRFVRGMVAWIGFRQEPVRYRRAARAAGETKYPVGKMLRLAADSILSFSLVPLRLAIWLGFLAAGLALLGIVYAFVVRLATDAWVPGWALTFIGIVFLGGIQLLLIGVLGEYIGRIYGEVKRRPLYLVKERIGFPQEDEAPSTGAGDVVKRKEFSTAGDFVDNILKKNCYHEDGRVNVEALVSLARENGKTPKEYSNPGMYRMNIGNMLRPVARRRHGLMVNDKFVKAPPEFTGGHEKTENPDGSPIGGKDAS